MRHDFAFMKNVHLWIAKTNKATSEAPTSLNVIQKLIHVGNKELALSSISQSMKTFSILATGFNQFIHSFSSSFECKFNTCKPGNSKNIRVSLLITYKTSMKFECFLFKARNSKNSGNSLKPLFEVPNTMQPLAKSAISTLT